MKKKLGRLVSICLTVALLSTLVVLPVKAVESDKVFYSISEPTSSGEKSFTVDIKVNSESGTDINIVTAQANVKYDPKVIQLTEFLAGELPAAAGQKYPISITEVDETGIENSNRDGEVVVGVIDTGAKNHPTPSGTLLATLTFTAVAGNETCTTEISIDGTKSKCLYQDGKSSVEYTKKESTPVEFEVKGDNPTLTSVKFNSAEGNSTQSLQVTGTGANVTYNMKAFSAKGTDITSKVTWSVDSAADDGVSITSGGVLTVTPMAKAKSSYTITATAGSGVQGGPATATLTVTREEARATTIKIFDGTREIGETGGVAQDIIGISNTKDVTRTYTGKVYDQFGSEMTGKSVTFTIKTGPSSANIEANAAAGTVTVKQTADGKNDTVTLTASCDGVSKDLVVTAKNVVITWDPVNTAAKTSITYGETNADAFTNLPRNGTGTAYAPDGTQVPLSGEFTVVDGTTKPEATAEGTKHDITVNFHVTTSGYEADYTNVYQVEVKPRSLANAVVTLNPASATYTGSQLTPGVTVTDDLGNAVASSNYEVVYGENTNAGTNAGTVTITGKGNYTGTKTATFTINPAQITLDTSTIKINPINANDTYNKSKVSLDGLVNDTLGTVTGSFGSDAAKKTVEFKATWNSSEEFVPTGKTYTYKATLSQPEIKAVDAAGEDPMKNYTMPANPTVQVVVNPVKATTTITPGSNTVAKKVIDELTDENMSTSLGLPSEASVTYEPNTVTSPAKLAISGWSMTVAEIKSASANVATKDAVITLTPKYNLAENLWITLVQPLPTFTLTVTNKFVAAIAGFDVADKPYDGTPVAPDVTGVTITDKDKGTSITENTAENWTFTYQKSGETTSSATAPKDAGTYTVTATYENETHKGSVSDTFTISPKSITGTVAAVANVTYNGEAHTPTPEVKDSETVLTKDTDYELTYTNNINAGTATINVTFKGNYTGTTTQTFVIDPLALTADNTTVTGVSASYAYTGSAIAPKVNVTVPGIGKTLVEGTDYTLGYADNVNATNDTTKATITITGKGNYSGPVTKTFEITKAALSGIVTITNTDTNSDGKITPTDVLTADVTDIPENTKLTYQWMKGTTPITGETGNTYTVKDTDTGSEISVKVTADGTGNYTGDVTSGTVKVGTKPITASDVTVSITATLKDDGTVELSATVTAQGSATLDQIKANFKVQWYCNGKAMDNGLVAIGDGGTVTCPAAAEPGNTYTCAVVSNSDEYSGSVPATGTPITSKPTAGTPVTNGSSVKLPADKPSTPTVNASAGNGSVTLSWSAKDNGSPITNWIVTGNGETLTLPAETTSYTFTGLTNGTAYDFTVKGVNAVGESATAGTASATPKAPSSGGGTSSGGSSSSGGGWWTHPTTTNKNSVNITSKSDRHGSVSLSNSKPSTGSTVTITVKPDKDYEVDQVRVTDGDGKNVAVKDIGNNKFTFKMPAGTVDVDVTYKQVETTPEGFVDVPDSYWAKEAIEWVNENGYMKGNSETTFNPDGRVTRQQLWMILARMAGAEPYDFTDAKNWAISNGISDGSNPGNSVTRQQMVTILYRYAQMQGYTTTGGTDISSFPDSNAVAAYAQEAISWSVGNSIVGGTTDGRLNPNGTATRAQFATILQRFYNTVTW